MYIRMSFRPRNENIIIERYKFNKTIKNKKKHCSSDFNFKIYSLLHIFSNGRVDHMFQKLISDMLLKKNIL